MKLSFLKLTFFCFPMIPSCIQPGWSKEMLRLFSATPEKYGKFENAQMQKERDRERGREKSMMEGLYVARFLLIGFIATCHWRKQAMYSAPSFNLIFIYKCSVSSQHQPFSFFLFCFPQHKTLPCFSEACSVCTWFCVPRSRNSRTPCGIQLMKRSLYVRRRH